MTLEVNGRIFTYEEFCQLMANAFTYLAKGATYELEKSSYMEGMQTIWRLLEVRGEAKVQIGPSLYFSNVHNAWVGFSENSADGEQIIHHQSA